MVLYSRIVSSLFLFWLILPYQGFSIDQRTTYYPTYTHQVINILKKEVEKEFNILCCGRGGSLPTDIRSISVDFETKKPATIEESRRLLVDVSERFRKIINEHENIRPFLREYPFPNNRIEIAIGFNSRHKASENKSVDYVFCVKGQIFYNQRNLEKMKHVRLYEESYEEALQIVNSNR